MNILYAQHPVSVHLTEKDGLPDIEFYDIVEDNKGFIWLAADKGLYRYDGKTFKNYSHPKKRGLSVFGLKLDDKGRVWCNNISGQYFYIEDDYLQLFIDLKTYTKGQLASFLFHKEQLIVSSFKKLLRVDLKSKVVKDFLEKHTFSSHAFKNKDTLFYLTQNKIKHTVNNQLTIGRQELAIDTLQFLQWSHTYFKGKLLLFGYNHLLEEEKLYFQKKKKLKELVLANFIKKQKIVSTYIENDFIWFSTDDGIYVYEYVNNYFIYKTTYFKGHETTKVIKDKNGNYWVTTLRDGVYIIPNRYIQQYELLTDFNNVTAIEIVANNKLIIGSTKGKLAIVNTNTHQIDTLAILSEKKVFALANNGKNEVYVSFGNKSYILDKNKSYKIKPKGKNQTHIYVNAKDFSVINNKRYVLAAYSSAILVDREQDTTYILKNKRAYTSHYSQVKKEIYVGYVDGVEMYKEDLKPVNITFNKQPIFAIDIDETSDGTVWVSTFNNGLIGIKNGKAIANYSVKNGLLSNHTSSIKADGNELWIATDKSIQRFNTQTKSFKNLTKKDGITSFNISSIAILNDKVCFSSNKGLFQLDKKKVFKAQSLSNFYFTNVLVEDEFVPIQTAYSLPSGVNKIQFQFHTNGFLAEEDIQYQYRLLGASDTWTNVAENMQQITFNSLSAGKYDFQLKAVGNQDDIETPVKIIHIKISQVFYKEWWFITTCILLGGMLIIGYYKNKLRINENEKQLQLEKAVKDNELVFLKLENLRSQMNPHFIFNALNSIQEYILLNQKNLAGDYLGKFANLIRMYLHQSTTKGISLSEEIEALNQYLELEKLRFEDSLHYQIKVINEIDKDNIEIPTMLIQPYVENAIKHGLLHKKDDRNLAITFTLEKEEQNLLCEVTDNGVGRVKASMLKAKRKPTHQSFASKATNDRLELLNYGKEHKTSVVINDLYSKENISLGTQVLISIPYIER